MTDLEILESELIKKGWKGHFTTDSEVFQTILKAMDLARKQVTLGLPSVSKCAQFFNDHLTTSITKCNVCGREKWEHSDVY